METFRGEYCLGALLDGAAVGNVVVGGPFLKDRVLVFEKDTLRIGIVTAANRAV